MTIIDPLAETQRVDRAAVFAALNPQRFAFPLAPRGLALQAVFVGGELYFAALTIDGELLWRVEVGEA